MPRPMPSAAHPMARGRRSGPTSQRIPGVGHPREHDGGGDPETAVGSYFPDWLLERRERAGAGADHAVATCYLLGVSTRRMEKLVETLGITWLCKSQVSVMARELDEHVESFRMRPVDHGPQQPLTKALRPGRCRRGASRFGFHVRHPGKCGVHRRLVVGAATQEP